MTPMDNHNDRPETNAPSPEELFSLEDILAEYGGSLEQQLLRGAEAPPEAPEQPPEKPAPEKAPPAAKAPEKPIPEKAPPAAKAPEKPIPEKAPPAAKAPEKPIPEKAPPAAKAPEKPIPEKAPPAAKAPEKPIPEKAPPAAKAPEKPAPEKAPPAAKPPEKPGKAAKRAAPKPDLTEEPTKKLPNPPGMGKAARPTPPPPDPIQEAERAGEAEAERLKIPRPRPISLEDVVGSTVDAVMEEAKEPKEPSPPPRRKGLFSRKPMEEAETIPPPPAADPEPDPEPIGPEPSLWEAAHDARQLYIRRRHTVLLPLVTALPPTLLLILERYQIKIPYWSGDPRLQCLVLLTCLALTAVSCRHVFLKGFGMLPRRRCVSELLVSLSALVSALDCLLRLFGEEPGGVTPYASVSCLALVFAQWGVRRESKGNYDMLRAASMDDEPPYLVTNTPQGACKQRGSVPGFFTTASRSDAAALWQTVTLPVALTACVVFAVLSSVGQGRKEDFLLNLSAILPAAATFSLPLCWALPWSKLSEHLQKTGCAVAGWSGAQKISARRRMIVTDGDLFPPGSVQLNGRKLYGEDPARALSLAASMVRAAGSGLERLFNSLIRAEGGSYEKVDDFSFYEEGGWSGVVRGESILMGGASFMRKMNVRLPADVNLRTGIFLAVDRQLAAVFAVKYSPSENVAFALKMMQRSHIQPILASRDPNITPALLRRKFSKGVHLEYPGLTERIALSEAEKDRDLPRALLFREGLLPYAEAVAGSLRLCKAVRRAVALSLLGSCAGILLAFYFTSLGAYDLLNPLTMEVFLLLWTLPVLLMADWTGRY